MFRNRNQAGLLLASEVAGLNLEKPVVIGIPRGGVEVAAPIAKKLGAPLYVILPRKIGAPHNPEFAVGALAPDHTAVFDEETLDLLGLTPAALQPVIEKEKEEIKKRLELYGRWGVIPDLAGCDVILVDDGIATGQTVKAALSSLQKKTDNPLILAVPVLPEDAVPIFTALAGRLVFLEAPRYFRAVGQFYEDFSDLPHETLISLLEETNSKTQKSRSGL
ncbi:MAG: phosphoribosyltransferase family protein [Peptococcaceae bacterium]|nr:phosphoribosyltransferase family protein [Peptococcaceae bacterium]MDH7525039.1 phosphoribosyltransferase family protein [Peptococcaceae bacterium]